MAIETISLEDGKYQIHQNGGEMNATRNGEPWRDLTGDKMIGAMFSRIKELEDSMPVAVGMFSKSRGINSEICYHPNATDGKELVKTLNANLTGGPYKAFVAYASIKQVWPVTN